MSPRYFDWERTWRSFGHAGRGLQSALATQPNLRVHAAIAVVVLGAAWLLGFSALALALLAVTVGLVLAAELLNTALETFMDHAWPEKHERVRQAKDASAAAVLLAVLAAVLVGALLFGRRLLSGSV